MEKSYVLSIPKKSNKESSSWEELAFAEDDAAGSLWPPRSYTCSFCRKEFKSAQALGGHMNVHRRDRARRNQSNNDQYLFSKSHNNRDHHETSCYTLVFNSKPNLFNKSQQSCVIDLSSSPFSLPTKKDTSPSLVVEEPYKNSKKICDLNETSITEQGKKRKIESMNLIGCDDQKISSDDHILKRRRVCRRESSSEPLIFVSSLSCKSDIIARNEGNGFEDLDLELRLGANPHKRS
ncbi:unnamed protein product [Cochlearia groenlandica]